jgi:hypothetical protein
VPCGCSVRRGEGRQPQSVDRRTSPSRWTGSKHPPRRSARCRLERVALVTGVLARGPRAAATQQPDWRTASCEPRSLRRGHRSRDRVSDETESRRRQSRVSRPRAPRCNRPLRPPRRAGVHVADVRPLINRAVMGDIDKRHATVSPQADPAPPPPAIGDTPAWTTVRSSNCTRSGIVARS